MTVLLERASVSFYYQLEMTACLYLLTKAC
jgi:hypothetical protein